MALAVYQKQQRGVVYLGFRDGLFDFDAFGCFYETGTGPHGGSPSSKQIVYFFRRDTPTTCPQVTYFHDLPRLPGLAWFKVRYLKPVDRERRFVPLVVDEKETEKIQDRFQRCVCLYFFSNAGEVDAKTLETTFLEKMEDRFYRGDLTIMKGSGPRPESPKPNPLFQIYDEICRLREDVSQPETPCTIKLNLLIQNLNLLTSDVLPPIEILHGHYEKQCTVSVKPLQTSIKVTLKSKKKVPLDDPSSVSQLTLEELKEVLVLLDQRSTERDQMSDTKRLIVEKIVENEKLLPR
jgi:hypothetical protein